MLYGEDLIKQLSLLRDSASARRFAADHIHVGRLGKRLYQESGMRHPGRRRKRVPGARAKTARKSGALGVVIYQRLRLCQGYRPSSDKLSCHLLMWSSICCIRSPSASMSETRATLTKPGSPATGGKRQTS